MAPYALAYASMLAILALFLTDAAPELKAKLMGLHAGYGIEFMGPFANLPD